MRIGSLFAGIGGFDLAARWMGWETAWFSEVDEYASAVLAKHWPGVPNHGDITRIDFGTVEPVDMLCGGFPCQGISAANPKGKGLADERSGLWSEYARAIRELRPRWVVIENSDRLLRRGFPVVRGDLRAAGYRVARPVVMSAAAVGAPHIRARFWLVAHADSATGRHEQGDRRRLPAATGDGGQDVPHALLAGTGRRPEGAGRWRGSSPDAGAGSGRGGSQAHEGWHAEPAVGRVAHGIPARTHRLAGLGNAIVPQCALVVFQAIQAREQAMKAVA